MVMMHTAVNSSCKKRVLGFRISSSSHPCRVGALGHARSELGSQNTTTVGRGCDGGQVADTAHRGFYKFKIFTVDRGA